MRALDPQGIYDYHVTAVDVERRVLPEAARGPHVSFAAPGADLAVAKSGSRGFSRARGTSFASPLVAGLLAVEMSNAAATMNPSAARRAIIDALIRSARDIGAPGRDTTYGFGLVGEHLRIDPARADPNHGIGIIRQEPLSVKFITQYM